MTIKPALMSAIRRLPGTPMAAVGILCTGLINLITGTPYSTEYAYIVPGVL